MEQQPYPHDVQEFEQPNLPDAFLEAMPKLEEQCLTLYRAWRSVERQANDVRDELLRILDPSTKEGQFFLELQMEIIGNQGSIASRDRQRQLRQGFHKLVPMLINVHLYEARAAAQFAVREGSGRNENPFTVSDSHFEDMQESAHKARKQGKREISAEHIQGVDQITVRLEQLRHDSYAPYYEIEQTSQKLVQSTVDYISGGKSQFLSFTEWLAYMDREDDGVFRPYLQALASDWFDPMSGGELAEAINRLLDPEAANVDVIDEFLDRVMDPEMNHSLKADIAAIFSFMQLAHGQEDAAYDPRKVFASHLALWPPIAAEAYATFSAQWKQEKLVEIREILSRYHNRHKMQPTLEQIDDLWKEISRTKGTAHFDANDSFREAGRRRKRGRQQKTKRGGRVTPSKQKEAVPEVKPTKLYVLKSVQIEGQAYDATIDDMSEIHKMVQEYADKYKHETSLGEILLHIIEDMLSNDPTGPGTAKLTGVTATLTDKKTVSLRRYSPQRDPRIETRGAVLNRTRIVYVLDETDTERRVAIRHILHYDEMDKRYNA